MSQNSTENMKKIMIDGNKSVDSKSDIDDISIKFNKSQIETKNEGSKKGNVIVAIRIRPMSKTELEDPENHYNLNIENENAVTVEHKGKPFTFNYDFVANEKIDQACIFNEIAKPITE